MDRGFVSAVRSPFCTGVDGLMMIPAENSGRLDSVHRRDTSGPFSGKGPPIFHDFQGGTPGTPRDPQGGTPWDPLFFRVFNEQIVKIIKNNTFLKQK